MAMDQALDNTAKPSDKTPDTSNITAAAQWQNGDAWKNALQTMTPPDTGTEHLPAFSIDNSGSGNINFNINVRSADNSNTGQLDGNANSALSRLMDNLKAMTNTPTDTNSAIGQQIATVEKDLKGLENDLKGLEQWISGLGNTGLPAITGGGDNSIPPVNGGGDNSVPPVTGGDNSIPPVTGGDNSIPPATGGGDNSIPPANGGTDLPTPIPPVNLPASGNFTVQNGQIIGPDGKPFVAKGIADYAGEAAANADQIMKDFPGINMIRLATDPNGDSAQSVQDAINAFTAKGIVVEVEDHHSPGGQMNTYTGQDLANQENWYAKIAAANKNNPYVWFGTPNEPNSNNPQEIVDQEVGVYNAIRGAGNNNMVMLELQGGGTATPMQADAAAYQGMSNVAWDGHYYGWVNNYQSGPGVAAGLQSEIQQAQTVTGADGTIPFIIGEYGNSTDGTTIDANGQDVVNAVQSSGLGTIAWAWNNSGQPSQADSLTDGSGNLTELGQSVAQHIQQ